jgi:Cu(I)/Ag(I) efflux system membrane protein CusA/SilA
MLQAIIRFSVRRNVVVLLAALLVAVVGVLSIRRTPMDAVPDLSENQVIVFAEWAGHGRLRLSRG